jgi:hypothetical protein
VSRTARLEVGLSQDGERGGRNTLCAP